MAAGRRGRRVERRAGRPRGGVCGPAVGRERRQGARTPCCARSRRSPITGCRSSASRTAAGGPPSCSTSDGSRRHARWQRRRACTALSDVHLGAAGDRRHARARPHLRRRVADRRAERRPEPRPRWPTWPICPASSAARWPCPTSTSATASPSAAWRPSTSTRAWSRRAAWATTSTAACGCWPPTCDATDVEGKIEPLVDQLFRDVPSGVGASGAIAKLSRQELERVLVEGAGWAVEQGYGSRGRPATTPRTAAPCPGADPGAVSERAYARGQDQVGTLGSGNHFLEIQVVDEIFDREAAAAYGLREGQVTVMIHCGSRGLRLPGLRRLPGDHGRRQPALRHRPARPAAGLRAGDLAGGPRVPGGHGLRRQLRLGQPADDHAPRRAGPAPRAAHRAQGTRTCAWSTTWRTTSPSWRPTRWTGAPVRDLRAPQGRHPGLRPGQAGGAGRLPARSGSRCSSPATWARPRSSARAPTRP